MADPDVRALRAELSDLKSRVALLEYALAVPDLVTAAAADGYALTSDGAGRGAWEALPAVPVYLTTPLTNAAWDSDAKAAVDSGVLDLSALFGLPAGITAVYVQATMTSDTIGRYMLLGPSATYYDTLYTRTAVVNRPCDATDWVPCDANGDIYVKISGDITGCVLRVWGYLPP